MHSGQQKYDKRSFPNCKQVKHWHFISAAAFSREYMLIQFSELHKEYLRLRYHVKRYREKESGTISPLWDRHSKHGLLTKPTTG